MNLSKGNLYLTYAIIAINLIVFILMAIDGAGLFEPNGLVHLKWGSNFAPLTLNGDWWRLLTCTFIHFGVIHVALNMYCLYTVSIYLEPMLGKAKFITAYLCTGILSSVASLWWHTLPVNSAGASGAVFGMYGVFLALLTSNIIPKQVRQSLLKSIGIFVAYNLIYGLKGGVDNSAHIGGLLSGFVIGYIYLLAIKKERQDAGKAMTWLTPAVAFISILLVAGYLSEHKGNSKQRTAILQEIKNASFKDDAKFDESYTEFLSFQEKALAVKSEGNTDAKYTKQLTEIVIPNWKFAETLAKKMQNYSVSAVKKNTAGKLTAYAILRQQETGVLLEIHQTNPDDASERLKIISDKLSKITAELQ